MSSREVKSQGHTGILQQSQGANLGLFTSQVRIQWFHVVIGSLSSSPTFPQPPAFLSWPSAVLLMFSLTHHPSLYFSTLFPQSPDSSFLASPECGRANSKGMVHQEQLPSPSTHAPKPTERAPSDMGTSAQPYLPPILLQYTQQPTLPAGVLPLNKNLTHANETTISSVGHNLEAGHEAGANQKQLKENVGPTAQTSAMVPVLSLLGIVFLLTGVLLFVLCKRRKQSLQRSPGKLGL